MAHRLPRNVFSVCRTFRRLTKESNTQRCCACPTFWSDDGVPGRFRRIPIRSQRQRYNLTQTFLAPCQLHSNHTIWKPLQVREVLVSCIGYFLLTFYRRQTSERHGQRQRGSCGGVQRKVRRLDVTRCFARLLMSSQIRSAARCWIRVSHPKVCHQFYRANNHSTRPTVDVLAKSGVKVTVACRTLEKAQGLAKGIPNTNAISV